MSAAAIALLRCIAELAAERRPLPEGLRASGIPGAAEVADALAAGADLEAAMSAVVPRAVAAQLVHASDLVAAAALAADELELRRERRDQMLSVLSYPALCAVALALMSWGLHAWWDVDPSTRWLLWALPLPLLLALAALLLPACWPLGPLTDWRRHAAAAGRYARAALVVRWRLEEAVAVDLLGCDLQRLLPLLGSPEAEGACIRLRRYHLRAGRRSLKRLALLLACALYIAAGAITLGTMEGYWNGHIDRSVRLGSR